jgi:hypothetical protein
VLKDDHGLSRSSGVATNKFQTNIDVVDSAVDPVGAVEGVVVVLKEGGDEVEEGEEDVVEDDDDEEEEGGGGRQPHCWKSAISYDGGYPGWGLVIIHKSAQNDTEV